MLKNINIEVIEKINLFFFTDIIKLGHVTCSLEIQQSNSLHKIIYQIDQF